MSDTRPAIDSADPPAGHPTRQHQSHGFTLLELVVVLALLGLVTALVAPSGIRTIETWRRSSEVEAALGSLAAIGARAHRLGRGLQLETGEVPTANLPDLPEGWTVVLDTPLQVQANGACNDSRGELRADDGYVQPFELQAPFCRAGRADTGPR
ncbi:MAG: prepilin-type N-terminal cleavage/methylation domain-containing protein [Lysobacter sp.]